ncbi:hypothetical protein B0T21DRAFT_338689 [Apiosordaria backusii]|uniref:DUF7728 domain-containing protein n=1 Tax=Apiosordaria backusii TaxID=314023 RepID=A0AA40AN87_9PEZI|nr:hypothetical protein B0T21DRAFT_338689 [Apiosordaria backusii]
MLMKSLSLAAAGLLAAPAAHAFLIPPEISESDLKIVQEVEFAEPKIAEVQPIDLECPGCPLNIKGRFGQDIQVKTDRPNHLELLFSIEHRPEGGDRLMVNDFELYPFADPFSSSLIAPQVLDDNTEVEKRHDHHGGEEDGHRRAKHHRRPKPQPQRLGFGLHVSPIQKDTNGKLELIEVELQIIEIGYSFVDSIPKLKVNLVKDQDGKLLMTTIEKASPEKLVEMSEEDKPAEECTTTLCQLMAAAHEKMEQLRKMRLPGCHGGKEGMGMKPSFNRPHGEHHRGGHHEPRPGHMAMREHSWGKLFKNITSHILLPVLIGIVAGVSVSLIGMAVGTVIVALWRFFRKPSHTRRHSRRHSLHKTSHKEAVVAEEKSGLLAEEEEQDAPPAYQDADTTTTTKPAEEV